MNSTNDKQISKLAERTIEIKLSDEEVKAIEECFKSLKEIQPVVIDFEDNDSVIDWVKDVKIANHKYQTHQLKDII